MKAMLRSNGNIENNKDCFVKDVIMSQKTIKWTVLVCIVVFYMELTAKPSSSAQEADSANVPLWQDVASKAHEMILEGRTLQAVLYEQSFLKKLDDPDALDRMGSRLHQDLAFAGRWRQSIEMLNERNEFDEFSPDFGEEDPEALEPMDALAAIVRLARNRQIVIINESHHMSEHRLFSKRLALALREIGYTWLAAEAFHDFSTPIEAMATRGFPVRSDGVYLNDPYFADFVRSALAVGYRPVRYEINTRVPPVDTPFRTCDAMADLPPHDPEVMDAALERFLEREKHQACNIYLRVFKDNPEAKLLVHVGHAHVWENIEYGSEGAPKGPMAAFLKLYTGLDPLTIDQTHGSNAIGAWAWGGRPDEGYVPLDLALRAVFPIEQPTVFRRDDGSWLVSPLFSGRVDMTLYHPALRVVEGRPSWLAADPDRRAVRVLPFLEPPGHPFVVEAVYPDEGPAAIPVDQVFDQGKSTDFTLFLPIGESFTIRLQCPTGDIVELGSVRVSESDTRFVEDHEGIGFCAA